MQDRNSSSLTNFMTEKAKSTFDLDETINLIQEDFPIRTTSEEFQKVINNSAQRLGIPPEKLIEDKLKPMLGGQNIRNWLRGKVAISRDSAIRIAFALSMKVEEAEQFLRHSCGYDGFYFRDYRDIIFAFSLDKGYSHSKAIEIISGFSTLDIPNPDIQLLTNTKRITELLQNELFETVTTEERLKDFLKRNSEHFGTFRRKAYEIFIELYETLKESNSYSDSILTDDDICEMVLMNIPSLRGRNDITHKTLKKIAEKTLPRSGLSEIINKIPDKKTGIIPQVDRKHLILIWLVTEGGAKPDFEEIDDVGVQFEECIRILNYDILDICGMPHLDARNPFDWLILNALYYNYIEEEDDDAVERIETVMEALFSSEV